MQEGVVPGVLSSSWSGQRPDGSPCSAQRLLLLSFVGRGQFETWSLRFSLVLTFQGQQCGRENPAQVFRVPGRAGGVPFSGQSHKTPR